MTATLGILGAGRAGGALARLAAAAGYRVLVTGSGDPGAISLGAGIEAAQRAEVLRDAELIVLAIPLARFPSLPAESFDGKVVVDAMNYWWASDGIRPEFDDPTTSTSELVQQHLGGARIVKALNHMGYHDLEEEARPAGAPDRKAIAFAGDDAEAKRVVAGLIDDLGFDPVDAGPLAQGIRFEPNTELFGADVDADEVRAILERFPRSARGLVVARARGVDWAREE